MEEVKTITAKFTCNSIEETTWMKNVRFTAVVGSNGENKDFNDATPAGDLYLGIHGEVPAANFFKVGKEYYLDIKLAE